MMRSTGSSVVNLSASLLTMVTPHTENMSRSILNELPTELIMNILECLMSHQCIAFAQTSKQGLKIFEQLNTPMTVPFPARVTNSRALEWTNRFHDLPPEMQSVLEIMSCDPCPDIFSSIKDKNIIKLYTLVSEVTAYLRAGKYGIAKGSHEILKTEAKKLKVSVPNLTNILLNIGIEHLNGNRPQAEKAMLALTSHDLLVWNAEAADVPTPDTTNFLMTTFTVCLSVGSIGNAEYCFYALKASAKRADSRVPVPDATNTVAKVFIEHLDPHKIHVATQIYELLKTYAKAARVSVPNMTEDLLNKYIEQVKQLKHPRADPENIAKRCYKIQKFLKDNAKTVEVSVPDGTGSLLDIVIEHIKTEESCNAQLSYKFLMINAKSAMVSVSKLAETLLNTVIEHLSTSRSRHMPVEEWYKFIVIIAGTAKMPVPDITEILLNIVQKEFAETELSQENMFYAAQSYEASKINAKTVKVPLPNITNILLNTVIKFLNKNDIHDAQKCYELLKNNAEISNVSVPNITEDLLDLLTQHINNDESCLNLEGWYELLKITAKAAKMSVPDITDDLMKIVVKDLSTKYINSAKKCYKLLKNNAEITRVSIPKFSTLRKDAGFKNHISNNSSE